MRAPVIDMPSRATIEDEHAWCAAVLASTVTRPHWRVWLYDAPQIVLGCSQRRLLAEVAARAASIPVCVRPSGGGAVLAGPWMIGVSAILPVAHPLLGTSLTDGYRWLGELFVRVLDGAGIATQALDPARQPLHDASADPAPGWACFGGLSAWEVVDAHRRKLVGLAQQRRRTGVLVTAGLLTSRPDWTLLCEAILGAGEGEGIARVADPAGDARYLAARTASCDEHAGARTVDRPQWAARVDAELQRVLATPAAIDPPRRSKTGTLQR